MASPTPPSPVSVSLTEPNTARLYGVGDAIPLAAQASSSVAAIDQVTFAVNGSTVLQDSSTPYAGQWAATGVGNHTVTAMAVDGDGNSNSSAPREVTVLPDSELVFSTVPIFGDRRSYTELNPGRWRVTSDGGDLRYHLQTSDYQGRSGERLGEYSVVADRSFADFVLTLKARTAEDLAQNNLADLCLVFGFVDENNYRFLMVNSQAGETALYKVVGGQRQEVHTIAGAVITDTAYHQLTLRREGEQVSLMVDGQQTLETTDSGSPASALGVGSFNDSVFFDNIAAQVPGCADGDNDGFGDPSQGCPNNQVDCDDTNPQRYPGAQEVCNDQDDDCDGEVDETFDLQQDPQHCGDCQTVCPVGSTCVQGVCTATAPGGDGSAALTDGGLAPTGDASESAGDHGGSSRRLSSSGCQAPPGPLPPPACWGLLLLLGLFLRVLRKP